MMVSGDAVTDICLDFESRLKVHNLISVRLKSTKLGQITNLNVVVYELCQFIDWSKFLQLASDPYATL